MPDDALTEKTKEAAYWKLQHNDARRKLARTARLAEELKTTAPHIAALIEGAIER